MKKLNRNKLLVIGIGNACRCDDALGWLFLDELIQRGFREDSVKYKYQLMVEDAEVIAQYETVVFVDASRNELSKGYQFSTCEAADSVAFSTHFMPPQQIVHLCKSLYGQSPEAFLLEIGGKIGI